MHSSVHDAFEDCKATFRSRMNNGSFDPVYTHLLWLENEESAAFCRYIVCLNWYIVVNFTYLEVTRGFLDDAMKQIPVLKAQGYQQMERRLLQ